MLYEKFFYIVFSRHSAGKIWSSICIPDSVLHYQINSVRLIWLAFCIKFVWQVNLWSYWQILLSPENPELFLHKINTPVNMALNKPPDCQRLRYTNGLGKVNTYAKLKGKYCKKSVRPCKSMWKLVWPNS